MSISQNDHVSRRDFLRTTTCGAAAAGMTMFNPSLLGGPATQPASQFPKPPLPYGILGKTKYPATLISLGAILLAEKLGTRVLKLAIDRGVNLVHTSESYGGGKSIAAVADLFKADKRYRDKVFLCLKGRKPEEKDEVDRMLKILGTDHADVVLTVLPKPQERQLDIVRKQQDRLLKQGKVRFKGFVCHGDMNGVSEMVLEKAPDYFDVALLAMTMAPIPGSKDEDRRGKESERFVRNLKALRDKGVGILSMKSGARKAVQKGADIFGPHVKAILAAGADAMLTSMDTYQQVEMACKLDLTSPHTQAERQAAADFQRSRSDACLMCGACSRACPQELPINDLMRFRMYHAENGWHEHARAEYAALGVDFREHAAMCGDCTACTNACPVGLASYHTIRETADWLA